MEKYRYIHGLGNTYYETIIAEYSVPELFTLITSQGSRYLAVNTSSGSLVTLVPVSTAQLKLMYQGKIPIYNVFAAADYALLVSLVDNTCEHISVCELLARDKEGPIAYLPEAGFCMKFQNEDVIHFLSDHDSFSAMWEVA